MECLGAAAARTYLTILRTYEAALRDPPAALWWGLAAAGAQRPPGGCAAASSSRGATNKPPWARASATHMRFRSLRSRHCPGGAGTESRRGCFQPPCRTAPAAQTPTRSPRAALHTRPHTPSTDKVTFLLRRHFEDPILRLPWGRDVPDPYLRSSRYHQYGSLGSPSSASRRSSTSRRSSRWEPPISSPT